MKTLADLCRWLGGGLKKLYLVDLSADPLTSIQQDAIERNRVASEENCVAAKTAATAINELLAAMEARTNGKR